MASTKLTRTPSHQQEIEKLGLFQLGGLKEANIIFWTDQIFICSS